VSLEMFGGRGDTVSAEPDGHTITMWQYCLL